MVWRGLNAGAMTARPFTILQVVILCLRALFALASARRVLHRLGPSGVLQRNAVAGKAGRTHCATMANEQCDRVAFFIPRVARRVPWRADCLVQALAGQQWLFGEGITSEIVVGTAKQVGGAFEAHAWLSHGDRVVLGGDIARFEPLLESDAAPFDVLEGTRTNPVPHQISD